MWKRWRQGRIRSFSPSLHSADSIAIRDCSHTLVEAFCCGTCSAQEQAAVTPSSSAWEAVTALRAGKAIPHGMCRTSLLLWWQGAQMAWCAHDKRNSGAGSRVVLEADCTGVEGAPSLGPPGAPLIAGAVAARAGACRQQSADASYLAGAGPAWPVLLMLHLATPQVGSGRQSLGMHAGATCRTATCRWIVYDTAVLYGKPKRVFLRSHWPTGCLQAQSEWRAMHATCKAAEPVVSQRIYSLSCLPKLLCRFSCMTTGRARI